MALFISMTYINGILQSSNLPSHQQQSMLLLSSIVPSTPLPRMPPPSTIVPSQVQPKLSRESTLQPTCPFSSHTHHPRTEPSSYILNIFQKFIFIAYVNQSFHFLIIILIPYMRLRNSIRTKRWRRKLLGVMMASCRLRFQQSLMGLLTLIVALSSKKQSSK